MGVSIKSCGYFFVTKSVCENKCITALINKKAGVRVTNIVLNITPAEYSKEPTNVTRPQWEREQTFAELIKQDALYCANNAESMEHFIFLLEKLGFEVKQGKHIAVKAPVVKKFTYRPAHLYEQIRKMHELQEEYLLMVDYNVHSYMDLFKVRDWLKYINGELCKTQKEMYRERAIQKSACKTYEDMALFEEKGAEYRE